MLSNYEQTAAKDAGRLAAMAKFNGFTNEQIAKVMDSFTSHFNETVINEARKYYTKFTKEIAGHPASKTQKYVTYSDYVSDGWTYSSSIEAMKKYEGFNWVLQVVN